MSAAIPEHGFQALFQQPHYYSKISNCVSDSPCFASFRDHCLFFPHVQCLQNHYFICFVLCLIVSFIQAGKSWICVPGTLLFSLRFFVSVCVFQSQHLRFSTTSSDPRPLSAVCSCVQCERGFSSKSFIKVWVDRDSDSFLGGIPNCLSLNTLPLVRCVSPGRTPVPAYRA